MILNEYQAKKVLADTGFSVPQGVVCESADCADLLAAELDTQSWVIKAQIRAGGRATGYVLGDPERRGGIRFANSLQQVVAHTEALLGSVLVSAQTGAAGAQVNSVYIEPRCTISREMYLSLSVDPAAGQLVLMVSREGGSDIEKRAANQPGLMQSFPVSLDKGELDFNAVGAALGLQPNYLPELETCLTNMRTVFVERDMLLMEINPLAMDQEGTLVALDATVVFDDNALFRQGHEEQMDAYTHLPDQEFRAAVLGLNYVQLDGDIATLAAGAGLAMATVDAIIESGGNAANFLDVPPSSEVSSLCDALELLLSDSGTACLLVNVFGGGIMRCDAVVDALLMANSKAAIRVPVVVRLAGTNASLGVQRLQASLPEIHIAEDLAEAARQCVTLARGKHDKGAITKLGKQLLDRLRLRKNTDAELG